MSMKLTTANVRKLPYSTGIFYTKRDSILAGFFVVISKTTKSYSYQFDWRDAEGRRRTTRRTVGDANTMSAEAARRIARSMLANRKPEPPQAEAATLRDGIAAYLQHLEAKQRSERTRRGIEANFRRYMADLLDTPLATLANKPAMVAARHERIAKEAGPSAANRTMSWLRATYAHAAKTRKLGDLPAVSPTSAVNWCKERKKATALTPADMPEWWRQLQALENPIRRELHLLLLLSGARADSLCRSRWADVDVARRALVFPSPKGGPSRRYEIPLSRQMLASLIRVRKVGKRLYPEQSEWLFPAASKSGHCEEHREARDKLSFWGHELRRAYCSAGYLLGVPEFAMRCNMGHSVGHNINWHYVSKESMRGVLLQHQQAISNYIFEQLW